MPKKKSIFVVIDGNAIIHRAYHALPPLTDKKGRVVNAVYGFTSMLLKILNDLSPTHLAVSFDVSGGTFRDDLYEGYKAKRVKADQALYDQIPLVYDVVRAFGIPIFTKEGFEADDVIGTIAEKTKKDSVVTVVVTGDKDMLQLVHDDITEVYLLKKGLSEFVLYNENKVNEEFGFGPERVVDYKAIRGDTSDNIPGITGIGEKGAKELIEKGGGIDQLYKQIRNPKSKIRTLLKPALLKKVEIGETQARMSYKLAKIRRDVPGLEFKLSNAEVHPMDKEKLIPLFQEFGFVSLVSRLSGEEGKGEKTTKKKNKQVELDLQEVDEKNANEFLKTLKHADAFACREVVNGKDVLTGTLQGFLFCVPDKVYYLKHGILTDAQRSLLISVLHDTKKTIIGHDLKQLIKAAASVDVDIQTKLFDVMIASYVVNSSTRAHDMRSLALRELGQELPEDTGQESLFGTDPKPLAKELFLTLELKTKLEQELKRVEDIGLFDKIEMALIPVLARMEMHGVAVDTDVLSKLSEQMKKDIETLTKKIHQEAGKEFNVASSTQLRDILFDTLELPTQDIKKGKTGYSTAASELEKLRGSHPIIEMIEEHRELAKLQNTYVDVLPGLINKKTGRIHTNFNQAVAATGRLSGSDPNLQNIPIRTDLGRQIRNAFIAEPGFVLIAADYSQIELRIAASLAQDTEMLKIFEKGEDIHQATAAVMNNVPLDKVTKEMRHAAKEVNFGVLYGMGPHGLAQRTGIPYWKAKEFIEKYFISFKGVKKYLDETLVFAKKEGYVETLFGRRRYIPELQSDNFQLRNAGERMAINMPIQGTAADLMKMAMIEVDKQVKSPHDVRMILQVHDELVLEVKKGLENDVAALVKNVMENVAQLRVPIEVHINIGKRWGDLK